MLVAAGLLAVAVLVGARIVRKLRRRALVRALPEGELRERFVAAYEAWSHAKKTAA